MLTEDQVFEKINFKQNPLPKGEYENCTFVACDLEQADLSGIVLTDCILKDSNLSNVRVNKSTSLKNVRFQNCKVLGLLFSGCNEFLFEVNFENCVLDFSAFDRLKMKKTRFKGCSLKQVDFSATDLTEAVFADCDLSGAKFERTILEKADLRTARQYTIDPEANRLKKARFSLADVAGLLTKYNIVID
ncbi:Pentapeptide repeat-containing protein [Flexibacter flexilis DSM 6793]|uniref:Pentapeptide repeat-containing protein n=1 Tax=Flexibacter flexilis DSM 6793 TaxID=927664 RepID=A0A1I1I2Q5_9BACT|nr:pentapeptide repeat-containing protein [Flexibacter flexilis]SFC30315.1 Pentapeptide repeat-containing protein [Flexibacter flexilis DSM 6793]